MRYDKKVWWAAYTIVFVLTLSTTSVVYLLKSIFGAEVAANLFILATGLLSFAFWFDASRSAAQDMIDRKRDERTERFKEVFGELMKEEWSEAFEDGDK